VAPGRSRVLISGTRKLGYTLKRHLRRRAAIERGTGDVAEEGGGVGERGLCDGVN
jgi:hypothetical protein